MAKRKDGKPRSLPRDFSPMNMSGFCMFPSTTGNSHVLCKTPGCMCECHTDHN